MTTPRTVQIPVSLVFLAIISSPGLVQVFVEARQGAWPQAFEVFSQRPSVANLRSYEASLEEASWVAATLRPWMQYFQFTVLNDAGEKGVVGREGWLFYKPALDYLTFRVDGWETARRSDDPLPPVVSYRTQLAARGIELLIVPAPNKESVYPEMLTRRARVLNSPPFPPTRELMERLIAARIEVVDLFAAFQRAKQESNHSLDQALYLAKDTHWSPAGVELAASTVARTILERGWVARGNTEYTLEPAEVRRIGDLVRMLRVPAIERHCEVETIRCAQVVRRDNGAPYQDDPDSEILVIGDSFLRVYETDDPGAAGFVAHLAKELRQPLTSLISDGGASTLVRQELYRRPQLLAGKRLVVWEFVERDIRFGTEGWQLIPLPTSLPKAGQP